MYRFFMVRCLGPCVLVACVCLVPAAQTEDAKTSAPKIDAKAEKVIKGLVDHMGQVKRLSVDIHLAVTRTATGTERTFKNLLTLAQERPNKVSLIVKEGAVGRAVVSDGKQLYACRPSREKSKMYTATPAPEDLWGIWQHRSSRLARMAFGGPGFRFMAKVFSGLPYEDVVQEAARVSHVGLADLDGSKCHRLEIEHRGIQWDLWVSDGPKPLPKKIMLELGGARAAPTKGAPSATKEKTLVTTVYKNWAINPKLPAETFEFTPPPGARRAEPRARPEPAGDEPPHPLLGRPAPDFELALLEGGRLKLSEHKGKNVVILDFWATWCGPCRQAMPILIEVANAYKDKGVVFCAVNLRESRAQIKSFLKKQKLTCSVGMDRNGAVARKFRVEGIPTSVLIGKDGTVQAKHVGFSGNLKSRLKSELDVLLAGENLAGKTLLQE